jgi:hypothetical protein
VRCFKCQAWSEALIQLEEDDSDYTISSFCYNLGKWTDYMYICPLYCSSHDKIAPILGELAPTRQAVSATNPFLVNLVQKLGGK